MLFKLYKISSFIYIFFKDNLPTSKIILSFENLNLNNLSQTNFVCFNSRSKDQELINEKDPDLYLIYQ